VASNSVSEWRISCFAGQRDFAAAGGGAIRGSESTNRSAPLITADFGL